MWKDEGNKFVTSRDIRPNACRKQLNQTIVGEYSDFSLGVASSAKISWARKLIFEIARKFDARKKK